MHPNHVFLRLLPPRPTFVVDMTDTERALMGQHALYMKQLFEAGRIITYGPVLDPTGPYGIAIFKGSMEEAQAAMALDPTVVAKVNTVEAAPMFIAP